MSEGETKQVPTVANAFFVVVVITFVLFGIDILFDLENAKLNWLAATVTVLWKILILAILVLGMILVRRAFFGKEHPFGHATRQQRVVPSGSGIHFPEPPTIAVGGWLLIFTAASIKEARNLKSPERI